MKIRIILILMAAFFCVIFPSCSMNKMATNMVADMFAGEGSADVFTSDPDPKLVGDALPFAIKLYETLLSQNPRHEGLMLTTGSLFIMYANAFVQGPAEMLSVHDWEERELSLNRAKQLYIRGYNILNDALEIKYPGFSRASADNGTLQSILRGCTKADAGLLYWAVAGGLSAYSIDLLDFELSSHLPEWKAMIDRAYELDPGYNGAAIDEFYIVFYASLPETMGGDMERAQYHFNRALERTNGNSAGAYVTYAHLVCVPAEDHDTFQDCLEKALAIDPDKDTSSRLVNVINQQKARWLLDNAWTFFYFLPFPDEY
ncbi:MAG: TRAP transporter TatT component family protein [Treponema sp.]|nr:TRAP transporter TatT component family protein [Treponema sp.]